MFLAHLTLSNMRKPTPSRGAGGGWRWTLPDATSFLPQNEKQLQDVLKQQEEKMLQLIDKSGEVTVCEGDLAGLRFWVVPDMGPLSASPFPLQRLKGEISQLKRSLQRAETEAKVLWEEMRGQEHKVDAVYVQERVLLRQEVRLEGSQG